MKNVIFVESKFRKIHANFCIISKIRSIWSLFQDPSYILVHSVGSSHKVTQLDLLPCRFLTNSKLSEKNQNIFHSPFPIVLG